VARLINYSTQALTKKNIKVSYKTLKPTGKSLGLVGRQRWSKYVREMVVPDCREAKILQANKHLTRITSILTD